MPYHGRAPSSTGSTALAYIASSAAGLRLLQRLSREQALAQVLVVKDWRRLSREQVHGKPVVKEWRR